MPTVIDSLIVTLGLDPANFTKGQKDAATAFTKTKEAATKTGKDIEGASQKAADSIDRIARNALKLFAIFTAGRAVKDFVSDITSADSALGRLATRIGQAPSDISSLSTAVQRAGGSAEAAQGSFQRFSDSIQELKATGNTGILPFLYRVQAAGGKQINLNKNISQTYEDLAENLKTINDTQGSATANYYGKQLGLDEGTVALLVKGREAYRAQIEESKRLGIATKADTEAASNLQRSVRTLTQASEGLGRTIMTAVTPIIVDLLKPLEDWIKANREWIATNITARIREFADYLKSIDWKGVGEGIRSFIGGADDAAKSVGGWKTVVEGLFALWLGSKFLGVLKAIGLLRLALTGGKLSGGLISALGLLGSSAIAAILATSIATDKGVPNADKPGVATRSDDDNSGAAVSGGSAGPRLPSGEERAANRRWVGRQWGRVKRFFGGGSSDAAEGEAHHAEGGAGIRTRAQRAKRGPDGIPYEAKSLNEGLGITPKQYDAYREGLTDIEGKNYAQKGGAGGRYSGRYQFGPNEIRQTAIKLGENPPAREQFLSDPAMQERYMERYTLDHHNYLMRKSEEYRGLSPEKKLEMLGYAHNQGEGGAAKYLRTGQAGSDGFGTSGTAYFGPIRRRLAQAEAEKAKSDAVALATQTPSADRRPDILADPKDGRRQAPSAAPAPSAWNGIPNAGAFAGQAQMAQAALVTNATSNDNRSSTTQHTRIGDVHVHTSAADADGIAQDMQASLRKRSFAMGANYGQA